MNVLVLTGSARPNSAGKNVAQAVASQISANEGVTADVVDVAALGLPFFNSPIPPSADEYEITDANVQAWAEKVKAADAVVWVMPEYNHSISGIQKNAIDWLYKEWNDKPLAIVAYGWYAGANVLEAVKLPLKVVQPDVRAQVGLTFNQEIELDGGAKDQAALDAVLAPAMKALVG